MEKLKKRIVYFSLFCIQKRVFFAWDATRGRASLGGGIALENLVFFSIHVSSSSQ